MRARLRNRFSIFFLVIGLISLTGCAAGALSANGNRLDGGPQTDGREVSIGESFKLENGEKVSVKGTGLTVELKGVRRSWLANGQGEYGEADVLVAVGGKEERRWMKLGATITNGEYVVKLSAVNPFGKTSAELIVTRG